VNQRAGPAGLFRVFDVFRGFKCFLKNADRWRPFAGDGNQNKTAVAGHQTGAKAGFMELLWTPSWPAQMGRQPHGMFQPSRERNIGINAEARENCSMLGTTLFVFLGGGNR
jgi:hypothetical protein